MALGALVGGITKGLLGGGAKKVAADKLLNRKKKPKESVEVREKKKGGPLAIRPSSAIAFIGGDTSDKSESSSTPNDVPSLFDRIKESLGRITKGLKNSFNFKKADEKSKEDQARKDAAKRREKILESIKRFRVPGEGMAKKTLGNAWNAMKRFFGNILIGGILVALLDNIKKIQEEIEKAINKIKEVWEKLEPFLTPIWDLLKWIAVKGIELTQTIWNNYFGDKEGKDIGKNLEGEADKIDKELKKVDELINPVKALFDQVSNFAKELKAKNPQEKISSEDAGEISKKVDKRFKGAIDEASGKLKLWEESKAKISVGDKKGSNLPSDYKQTEQKAFDEAKEWQEQKQSQLKITGKELSNSMLGSKDSESIVSNTNISNNESSNNFLGLGSEEDQSRGMDQNNLGEIAMDTNRARSLIRSGQVPVLTPGQAKDILNNPGAAGDLDMDTIQILKRMMVQNTGNSSLVASISKEASYDAEGGSVLVVPMATGSGGSSAGGGGGGSGVLPIIVEVNNNDQRIQSRMYRA